jgi:hypothetical protein
MAKRGKKGKRAPARAREELQANRNRDPGAQARKVLRTHYAARYRVGGRGR